MYASFWATPLHALLRLEYLDGPGIAEPEPGTAVVRMPVHPDAYGASGNLHGGAIATLIDVASASAAARNSAFEPGVNTLVTADIHVRYLGRPKGDYVDARGACRPGRSPAHRGRVPGDQHGGPSDSRSRLREHGGTAA